MVTPRTKNILYGMDITTKGMWVPFKEFKEAEKAILGYFDDKFSRIFKGHGTERDFKVHKDYYFYVGESKAALVYTQLEDDREWDREKRRNIPMGHVEVKLASDKDPVDDLAKTVLDLHSCLILTSQHSSYMFMNPKIEDI